MITDKHSQTLIFWCQKSLSPTSNSKIHHLNSSLEQSDLSSLNSLNKNEHYKSASQNIQSGHSPTKKHSETSLMSEVPSKINNFEGLEKVCHKFSQTFLWKRHDMPHQTSTENDPQNIVTHRIWQSTIRHTYRHSPYLTTPKRSNPHPQPPSFSKHFSNIYLFPDWRYSFWRFFSVGDSDCRRFDRTFREIRLTSRPEIRSDSGSDNLLTALTTPMI